MSGRPARRSTRLKGFDYRSGGVYFVTILTSGRMCVLGEVVDDQVRLCAIGDFVAETWEAIPRHFLNVRLTCSWSCPTTCMGSSCSKVPSVPGGRGRARSLPLCSPSKRQPPERPISIPGLREGLSGRGGSTTTSFATPLTSIASVAISKRIRCAGRWLARIRTGRTGRGEASVCGCFARWPSQESRPQDYPRCGLRNCPV